MNPEHTRRLIGGVAVLLGLCWTSITVFGSITRIWSADFETGDIVFLLTMVPLMAGPGIIALVFGVRLFRELQESYLKLVSGVFAVFFTFFLLSQTSDLLPALLPEGLQRSVSLFVASSVAIVAYLFAVRLLLRHFTQEDRSLPSLLSRGVLILMAWQVWLLLSEVFQEYSPIKEGYAHIYKEPWGILGVVVPIAVAYGLYRVAVSKQVKAQQDDAGRPLTAR
jgi:hypothetical protein